MDQAIYHGGRRRDIDGDISDAFDEARRDDRDCFVWIGLYEPTGTEFGLIEEELELHPLAVEDAVHAHQRPKLERYDETLFIVLKTLDYHEDTSDIEVGEIMNFLGKDFVVTVRHGAANPLAQVRKRIEADPRLLTHGPAAVVHAICDQVVDHYGLVSHEVEADITELERQVFRPHSGDVTEQIYLLKREVLDFRSAEGPLIPVLEEITRAGSRCSTAPGNTSVTSWTTYCESTARSIPTTNC
ncbi:magnesium and cobalt transport protein CorA [Actinomadura sp. NPDC023710]|uniref:magnesium and cobalt transport protein CorA n=1 Tax=Actinomadura sp. NPDC023710 TaxID=3158219 RepID=UPI00340230AE